MATDRQSNGKSADPAPEDGRLIRGRKESAKSRLRGFATELQAVDPVPVGSCHSHRSSPDMPFQRYSLVALTAVLLLSFALHIFKLDHQSLWYDEGYSFALAQQDPLSLIRATASDIHPPLYYYALKLWVTLAGGSAFSLRYLSLLLGMLLVPVTYAMACQLFGRRTAIAAAALAAFSPLYIYYSQEVRMYTLMGLFSQLAVYHFWKGMAAGRRWSWAGYAVFMVLALYSHLYAALIFVFLNLFFIISKGPSVWLRLGNWTAPSVRPYLASQAAVVIVFLPWLRVALDKVTNYTSPAQGSPLAWILEQTAIVFSLGHSVLSITSFPGQPDYDQDRALALALSLPFVGVATFAAAVLLRGRAWTAIFSPSSPASPLRTRTLFLLSYLLVPLFLIVLLSLGRRDFNARYLFAASPAFYMLVAVGLVAIGRLWLGRGLLLLLALLFAGIWGHALDNYYFEAKYARDDHRSAVDYIRRHALPGDLVILDAVFEPVYNYYAGGMLPWIRFPEAIPPDSQQTLQTLARIVPEHKRVWLVMWGDYFVDPERKVQRWLDTYAFPLEARVFHGPVLVYGYLARPPIVEGPVQPETPLLVEFEDQVTLLGYDLATYEDQSRRRVHLALYWQARQKLSTNFSIFAHLLSPAGQMLGLGDSQPVNGRLPTSAWEPGKTIRSEMDIWTFPASPPGNYRLLVGVYDQGTMRRLETGSGDSIDLGPVQLSARNRDSTALDYTQASSVQFGDSIRLAGYHIGQPVGGTLSLTLFWQAQKSPMRRFAVFNHLVDSSGAIVAQRDGEPASGAYPTERWETGEVIRDDYLLSLPADLKGTYRLLTGLYDPETGERLPIGDWWPFGKPSTAYELGTIAIGQ